MLNGSLSPGFEKSHPTLRILQLSLCVSTSHRISSHSQYKQVTFTSGLNKQAALWVLNSSYPIMLPQAPKMHFNLISPIILRIIRGGGCISRAGKKSVRHSGHGMFPVPFAVTHSSIHCRQKICSQLRNATASSNKSVHIEQKQYERVSYSFSPKSPTICSLLMPIVKLNLLDILGRVRIFFAICFIYSGCANNHIYSTISFFIIFG